MEPLTLTAISSASRGLLVVDAGSASFDLPGLLQPDHEGLFFRRDRIGGGEREDGLVDQGTGLGPLDARQKLLEGGLIRKRLGGLGEEPAIRRLAELSGYERDGPPLQRTYRPIGAGDGATQGHQRQA